MKKRQNKNDMPQIAQKPDTERQYLNIVVRVYVIFILAVYPLYVTGEGYNNIVFRKAQIYWMSTSMFLVAFAIFYVAYFFSANRVRPQKSIWKSFSFADWALLAFLIAVTLSFLFSPYKSMAWLGTTNRNDGYLTILLMIMCYFPISRYYKPEQLDFTLYAIGSSILCIIGFLQFYGYDFLQLFPYTQHPYADENGNPFFSGFTIDFRTTIGNIDFLSCYVCIAIIVFGVLFVNSKGWRQYLFLVAVAMNFALMIIGDADAGKVGTLGTMVLLIPYWIYTKKSLAKVFVLSSVFGLVYCIHHWFMMNIIMQGWTEENRQINDVLFKNNYQALPLTPILATSLICLAIGVCLLLIRNSEWIKPKTAQFVGIVIIGVFIAGGLAGVEIIGKDLPPQNTVHQAREIMHGNLEDDFGSRRVFIWKRAIERVQYQPIFGTGSDTFYYAFGKINQNEAKELHDVEYDKAHNDFIQILLCYGFPGLLTYLAFIAGIMITSLKKAHDNMFSLVALGGVLSYLIQSFFGVDTLIVTPVFWTILAVLRVAPIDKELQ